MSFNRVFITGMGVLSSAGINLGVFSEVMSAGKRALFPINDSRIAHFNARYAGLIQENIDDHAALDYPEFKCADRYVKLAAIAASEAIQNASILPVLPEINFGIVIGTCSGPMQTIENQFKAELAGDSLSEQDFFNRQYYSASVAIARHFGIRGPVFTVTTACSAFVAAVTAAADLIRLGLLDGALVGGADSFSTTTLAGFAGLKATHDDYCAPFSVPPGLNLGEGSGFVVLESEKCANARTAPFIGEILGYGLSNDAFHSSAPDPAGKGAAQSMQRALDDSGINPSEISYISAHGTGTAANDKAETKAIRKVFGEFANAIPVSSAKGAIGHCLGAAGAVETVSILTCAARGVYPPSVGFTVARDGCNLDYIPDSGRPWSQGAVFLKNNFAFGGNNASVVITTKKSGQKRKQDQDDLVCITGTGTISSAGIGNGKELNNRAGDEIPFNKKEFRGRGIVDVAEVVSFDLAVIDRRLDPRMERSAALSSIAAIKALASAGIPERQAARLNLGLFMSIAQGSTWAEQEHITSLLTNNYQLNQVNVFPYIVPNSVTGTVCRALSLTGYNATFCNGHGAGLTGLGLAWAAVRNNHVSLLLCGSVDDLSERGLVDCYLSEPDITGKKPLGEGASMVVLERYSNAKERGAVPLCFIKSFNFSYCPDRSNNDSIIALIKKALKESGISSELVGAICYNTGDKLANSAVVSVFGSSGYKVIDCSEHTGYVPASLPLMNLCSIINGEFIEFNSGKKYILTFFTASQATTCVALLEKFSDTKESTNL